MLAGNQKTSKGAQFLGITSVGKRKQRQSNRGSKRRFHSGIFQSGDENNQYND